MEKNDLAHKDLAEMSQMNKTEFNPSTTWVKAEQKPKHAPEAKSRSRGKAIGRNSY